MTDTPETKNRPDMNVFVKVPKGDETRIGAQIGVAFKHKNGSNVQGMNVLLDALPIAYEGRVELVLFENVERES